MDDTYELRELVEAKVKELRARSAKACLEYAENVEKWKRGSAVTITTATEGCWTPSEELLADELERILARTGEPPQWKFVSFKEWFDLWDTTKDSEIRRLCEITWNVARTQPLPAPRTVQEQPPFDVEAVVSANEREIKARSCQICGRELPGARSFSVCNGKCVETANKLSRLKAEAAEAYCAGQHEMRERAAQIVRGGYPYPDAEKMVRSLPLTGPELSEYK